jgi:hypothetical protein
VDENRGHIYVKEMLLPYEDENDESIITVDQETEQGRCSQVNEMRRRIDVCI